MRKTITYIALGLTLLSAGACSGFLDEFPDTGIAQEEAVQDMADMEKALISIYSSMKTSGLSSGHTTIVPDIQCDFMQAPIGFTNNMGTVYKWDFNAQNEEITSVWGGWWTVISRSNFLITSQKTANPRTAADTVRLQHILGEAHVARALAYCEMLKNFCDPYGKQLGGATIDPRQQMGLPIWEIFGTGNPPRASLYDSYQFILADLAAAKTRITKRGTDDVYFTQGALHALETRVHLYMGEWQKAITAATFVIDSCHYKLANAFNATASAASDYEQMWVNDRGSEIIWKVAFSKDDLGGALGAPFYSSNNGNYLPDYVPSAWVLNLYDLKDARYDIFFKEQQTSYAHKLTWPLLKKYPGNPALWKSSTSNYVNMPKVFRLSEIYLIRAEAYLENSQEDKAKKDLETLQAERTTKAYNLTDLRQAIRDERVRELYLEGHRLYDLKRWGLGFTRKAQQFTLPPANTLSVANNNVYFTWPIPAHELDVPGSQIVGNPSNNR